MRESLPATYKFPNKSIFHNNSQFTKERRLMGFDELVKRLLKVEAHSVEFHSFLEVHDHLSKFHPIPDNFSRTPRKKPVNLATYIANGPIQSPPSRKLSLSVALDSIESEANESEDDDDEDNESDYQDAATIHEGDEVHQSNEESALAAATGNEEDFIDKLNDTVRKDFFYILRSTYKTTTVGYGVCILFRFVDISHTSYTRMILTCLYLGLLMTFVRIILYKLRAIEANIQARKKET